MADDSTIRKLEAALGKHPRVATQLGNVRVERRGDCVVLEGVVDDIAARRLIPGIVGETAEFEELVDRLRVSAEPASDQALASALERALAEEPVFERYRLLVGKEPADPAGREPEICIDASDGVVRLLGTVGSITHRRLAEVFAWWTRGCSDVDNRLKLSPDQEDTDDEITDAVRIVLEKDPWLDASQLRIETHDRVVRLRGFLPGEEQKRMAENDAWYVPGVRGVDNEIVTEDDAEAAADEAARESFPASDPPANTPVTGTGGVAAGARRSVH